jgi:RNA polymerase-binding transcription factor DksA
MQLKQRIKRIESKVKINHSPFCACEDFAGMIKPRVEVVYESDGVQTIENPITDFCERCRKPIEKQRIIVRFVGSREQARI